MIQGIVFIAIALFLVVLFLLFRVQILSGVLNSNKDSEESTSNNMMGLMLFLFFLVGSFLMFYFGAKYWDDMIIPVASKHGVEVETNFWVSMGFIIAALMLTNFLLMFFAFKYSYKNDRVAKFYPQNHTLEMVWTAVPAIILAILIFTGWKSWSGIMDKAPSDVIKVEIRGEQFKWQVRYPGEDNQFGKVDYKRINPSNEFGMLCEDDASMDDFFAREIHIPVNKPVLFKIRARDVIHSVFAPHFRLKMDAVPGMSTKFWFTPTITTKEMNDKLRAEGRLPKDENGEDKEFKYEVACTEICGAGHFGMKKIIVVETQEEYEAWLSSQVPFFKKNPDACLLDNSSMSYSSSLTNVEKQESNVEEIASDTTVISDSTITQLVDGSDIFVVKVNEKGADDLELFFTNGSTDLSTVFEFGTVTADGKTLSDESKVIFDRVVAVLNAHPNAEMDIRGHTRNVGAEPANKISSKIRALLVKNYLKSKGIEGKRIKARGLGSSSLLAGFDSEDIDQRRITMVLTAI